MPSIGWTSPLSFFKMIHATVDDAMNKRTRNHDSARSTFRAPEVTSTISVFAFATENATAAASHHRNNNARIKHSNNGGSANLEQYSKEIGQITFTDRQIFCSLAFTA